MGCVEMKILILGHGQHGKDTFAEYLSKYSGLTFTSSSRAALDAIWPALKVALGYGDSDKELAYHERHMYRDLWKELISLYNTPDKAALVKHVLAKHEMYVGLRCPLEFKASKHLFDYIFWVDASDRKPLEPTMGIEFDRETMIPISNSASLVALEAQAEAIAGALMSGE